MNDTYDMVVIGAGTAGVIAAIQGGRAGAKTLLIEKTGLPGGTMTSGGIAFPGLFYAWRKQVIAGIGWELVTDCVKECGGKLPDFSAQVGMKNHPAYQIRLDGVIYAALCDEKLLQAGVEILYHTMIAGINGNEVTLCLKEGLKKITAKVIVDCTGDANAVQQAGYPVVRHEQCQPGTYGVKLSGYDPDSLSLDAIAENARKAVEAGELKFSDMSWSVNDFRPQFLYGYGHNGNHLWGSRSDGSEGRSYMEIEGRKSILRSFRFFRKQKGLENIQFEMSASECGVRESVTIVGEKAITVDDYVCGKNWPDGVCYAFYPVDLHNRDGVTPTALQEGAIPVVPLGALIPLGSANMLAAGRCISSDQLANSALRVQCTCMATGQAAGAAAALAAAMNCTPAEVPLEALKELLILHQAIVP